MSRNDAPEVSLALPRPGRVVKGAMFLLFGLWLAFAIGLNWGGASEELFLLLCGNTERILHGEIWRLFTAPLMHMPSGSIGHIVTAMLGLYFLSPSLEEQFGAGRFLRFLIFSALIGYGLQMLVELALPASTAAKLVPEYWFGAVPMIEAIAIAWALSFKGQTILFMMLIPMSSRTLIFVVIGLSLMALIAAQASPSGLIAPFGGMLSGWLLGGGTPSPLKRAWLNFRLAQLENEVKRDRAARKSRAARSNLRVIRGEGAGDRDADEPISSKKGGNGSSGNDQGPGGRFLN
jgi:membrane associated rhomboid family serine protease